MSLSLRSTFVLSLIGLVGSVLNMSSQLLLARTFGAGIEIDAYFAGLSMPLLMGGLISAAISYQVVPSLVHREPNACSLSEHVDALLFVAVVGGLTVSVLGVTLSATTFSYYPNGQLYVEKSAATIAVLGWIGVWGGIQAAVLTGFFHSARGFVRPALLGLFPPIATIMACGWVMAKGGSTVMVATAAAGGQLLAAFTLFSLRPATGDRWRMTAAGFWHVMSELKSVPWILLSMSVFTLYPVVDAFWAGFLREGSVTRLAYAQRLIVALAGLAVNGASAIALPWLAEMAAKGSRKGVLEGTEVTCRAIATLIVPVCVCVILFSEPTIRILFEGQRFGPDATQRLAQLVPFMLCGMIPMSVSSILFRALYALKDLRGAAWAGTCGALCYAALSGVAVAGGADVEGIGTAYIITWFIVLGVAAGHLWGGGGLRALVQRNSLWFRRLGMAVAWTVVFGFGLRKLAPDCIRSSAVIEALALIFMYGSAGIVFFWTAARQGMAEPHSIIAAIVPRSCTIPAYYWLGKAGVSKPAYVVSVNK